MSEKIFSYWPLLWTLDTETVSLHEMLHWLLVGVSNSKNCSFVHETSSS